MGIEIALIAAMMILTTATHAIGLYLLEIAGRRFNAKMSFSRRGLVLITIVLSLLGLHVLEIVEYAAVYRAVGAVKDFETALYFSGALTGLKAADPDLERLFDLYGAGRLQKLTRLRLPSAVPFLLEGHKVAAGLAVIGAVVAEFVAGSGGAQGLAWRILEAGNRLQTAKMFAALAVLGLMGAVLHGLFQLAERWALARWRGR